jgi:hypothetical protein
MTVNDPCNELERLIMLLRALRPGLSGAVRETVDKMFDNPDDSVQSLGVYPG